MGYLQTPLSCAWFLWRDSSAHGRDSFLLRSLRNPLGVITLMGRQRNRIEEVSP